MSSNTLNTQTTQKTKLLQWWSYSHTKWLLRIISLVLIVVCWQWRSTEPKAFAFPSIQKILPEMWNLLFSGEFFTAGINTLMTMLIGYLFAILIGIPLGIGLALSRWMNNTVEPLVIALYTAPVAIFIPVIGIYFGFDVYGRIVLVILWSVFVVAMNVEMGVRQTPQTLIEMSRAFGSSPIHIIQTIMLPSALPQILAGMRIGFGRAIRGTITAELLLAMANVGYMLYYASSVFNMPRLLGLVLFITLSSVMLLRAVEYIELRLLKWLHYIT